MRVLLTGAAGFIGSAIADQLRAAGHQVLGLDLLLPLAHDQGRPPAWAPPDLVVGDVRDGELLDSLLPGIDAVCHQAAMVGLGVDSDDAPDYISHNVLGTATLLAAMTRVGVRRLVQASSMVVYGDGRYRCRDHGLQSAPPRTAADLAVGRFDPVCPRCRGPLQWLTVPEDVPPDPRNAYAVSKVGQEQLGQAWTATVGGAATSLRYHNVYGPRMPRDTPYAGVASIIRSRLTSGQPPLVFEDGRQLRDFVHVADVARANVLALERAFALGVDPAPEHLALNIASGSPHSIGELAETLARARSGPEPQIVGGGRPGDVRHIVADPSRAAAVLGFRARVGFEQGMAEFADAVMREPIRPPVAA